MKHKRFVIFGGIAAAVCLIIIGILAAVSSSLASEHPSQYAADRWETKDLPYTQVSCFVAEDSKFASDRLYSIRKAIDTSLTAQALSPSAGNRIWFDAFSTEEKFSVGADDKKSVSARAFITGGDYFKIHEMNFISGWHYTDNDIEDDSVVIDKELAWELFGGYELDGMTLEINGIRCRIIGVVESPTGNADRKAYGKEPTVFVSYKFAERKGLVTNYSLYEVVIPNPVKGLGIKTVKENVSFGESNCEFVENDGRFGLIRSFKTLTNFDALVQRVNRIYFPYFENSARELEAKLAFISLLTLALLLFPVVYICTVLIMLYIDRGIYIEKIKKMFRKKKIKSIRR